MRRAGLVVLCGLAALSCGQVTSSAAPAVDAGAEAQLDAGDAADTDAGDAGADGGSWQKWCEPDMVNDPACPAAVPTPGKSCAEQGLECAYPANSGVALDDCAAQGAGPWWVSTGVLCRYDCAALGDAGAATAVGGAACDSRSTVACDPSAYQTNQMTLDSQLETIVQQCNAGGHIIWVGFDNGCATRIVGADSVVASCLAGKLAAQRFECALHLACGQASLPVL